MSSAAGQKARAEGNFGGGGEETEMDTMEQGKGLVMLIDVSSTYLQRGGDVYVR